MEWNAARLKFPVLSNSAESGSGSAPSATAPPTSLLAAHSFGDLCRLGLALTWPLAAVLLIASLVLLAILMRR